MNNQENNNQNRKSTSEEEIDLNKLFTSVVNGINAFFRGLFRLLFLFADTVAANLKIIGLLIILGGILGIGYTLFARPYYESSMTLGSVYYRGQLIDNSIQNLNRLCKQKNYRSLGRILQIPTAKAQSLKGIQIEPVVSPNMQLLIELYKETDGNRYRLDSLILNHEDTTFQIKVQVFDTTALRGLDTSLVNYILKNKFVQKRVEIERANLRSRRNKLIKESGSLDTLKRNIAFSYRNQAGGRTGTNNVILDDKGTNPVDIYREDLRLFDQLMEIERLLYINSEIEIIDPFIAFGAPKTGGYVGNFLKGLLGGLILAAIFIILKVINVGLKKVRSNLNQPKYT